MENVNLSEIQREQLLVILDKRFQKMSDGALLELERLTRHPVDLVGFQAKSNEIVTQANVEIVESKDKLPAMPLEPFNKPLTRQEFITYSGAGLLGLILCGTSYGWISSNASANKLSSTIAEVDYDIENLMDTIKELIRTADICDQGISEYLSMYPPTLNSITQLKSSLEKIREFYDQLDEMGIAIADVIQFIFNLLSFVPGAEKYTQPISTMMDMVINTPETIENVENLIANLNSWFSSEPNQGVINRVFTPAQLISQGLGNSLKPKTEFIQSKIAGL